MLTSLEMCHEVASRLKDISESIHHDTYLVLPSPETNWIRDMSFSTGLCGIACFFAEMDKLFPDQSWDLVAHNYLKHAIQVSEDTGFADLSLLNGMAGLCFSLLYCSKNGARYSSLLEKIESEFFKSIHYNLIPKIQKKLDDKLPVSPKDYNFSSGLSGIIVYLSTRKDSFYASSVLTASLETLCGIINRDLIIKGNKIPGWYVEPNHLVSSHERRLYPNGSFILSTPFGVSGVLSSLCIAASEGFSTDPVQKAIRKLANWLVEKYKQAFPKNFWLHSVSYEEEVNGKLQPHDLIRDTWFYGTPSVCRSLYLASKVLQSPELTNFAENEWIRLFDKDQKLWNLVGPSFSSGRAGLLTLTSQMANDTKNELLQIQINRLKNDLKNFFKPNSTYGFQMADITETSYAWVNDPGIFDGATGVALSLLSLDASEIPLWQRALLVR